MGLDERLRDVEAEAKALGAAGSLGVAAVEAVEKLRQDLGGDAAPLVLHRDPRAAGAVPDPPADLTPLRRGFHGLAEPGSGGLVQPVDGPPALELAVSRLAR